MSISSEIIRLETAKANIKEAIQSKGVTVPDGTKIDGMAEAIAAIEAGGAEGYVKGTATHTKADGMTLTGLSAPPQMVAMWIYQFGYSTKYTTYVIAAGWDGSAYTAKYGVDVAGDEGATFTPSVIYSGGTLNIKTNQSRFNGSTWHYMFVY